MKFLIVTSEYPPRVGGAGSYIHDLANGLAKIGHEVEIITRKFKNWQLSIEHDNLKIHYVSDIPKLFILLMWRKIKTVFNNSFDFILLNDVGATYVGSLFFYSYMINKTICFSHGQETLDIINRNLKFYESMISLKQKYFHLLTNCYLIIAVSKDQKKKIIESCKDKIEISSKFKIVYNSYDDNLFYFDREIFPDFNKKQINIVSVSRIVKQKGFDTKFDIMEVLFQRKINFHWYIIGDGQYMSEFQNKVQTSKIKDRVTFTGKKNRDELRKYYSNASLFLLLSEFRESFGLVYLEAIACGCPAVGLDNGGVSEVISNGVNGYLIKSSNRTQIVEEAVKIIELINTKPLEKGTLIKSVKKFEKKEIIDMFLNQIEGKYE